MPHWKALLIFFFGLVCLALVFGAFLSPLILTDDPYRWHWMGGFLAAAILAGVGYAFFLRAADREFMGQNKKKGR